LNHINAGEISGKDRMFLLFLMFISCFFIRLKFDNDTYWLINSGRYVLTHGIPHIEPFTFHQELHFVMQQWLSATVFALIYDTFGSPFLFALVALVNGFIIYSVFRLCITISEGNFLLSYTIALAISLPLNIFMVLRPFLFSVFLFSLELNFIEIWIQHNDSNIKGNSESEIKRNNDLPFSKRYHSYLIRNDILWKLPTLSVFLINLHAAMWPFFFVLLVPYFIDSFHFNLWGIKGQGYSRLPLIISAILSLAIGWLNPYGVEGMTYLFHSYGNAYVSTMIIEMKSPDFKTLFGIFIFIIYFFSFLAYCINRRGEYRLRYSLLIVGTGYMGLSSIRSLSLFVACGIPFLSYNLKSVRIINILGGQPSLTSWFRNLLISLLFIFLSSFFYFNAVKSQKEAEKSLPVKAVAYIKTHLSKENIRLYTDYETGGYVEFEGLKPFIDARADVFYKSNNLKEEIIDDYFNTNLGKVHYRELIKKYNLTHFLVAKTDLLYVYLPEDPDFELLFSDNDYKVFNLKTVVY